MPTKPTIIDYFKKGITDPLSDEKSRQIFIINLFSFIGMAVTGIMAVHSYYNDHPLLSVILSLASVIFISSFYLQKVVDNYYVTSAVILYPLFILMVYLVYSGGVNNTGPLWIFIVAPVAFYIHGFKVGLIDIAVFLLIVATIMFYPDEALLATSYSTDFKLRLLYSFLTITFLSGFYEHSRQAAYENLLRVSREYKRMAKIDPLTQLSNRRDALDTLDYESKRSERNDECISLLLCDIDHFKRVNDRYGHDGGDMVLTEIAKLFAESMRRQDTVSRWGGEEFLFILPQTNLQQAKICAENIHDAISEFKFCYHEHQFQVTISIGIAEIKPGESVHEAIKQADDFLYQAKKNGRNQICSAF